MTRCMSVLKLRDRAKHHRPGFKLTIGFKMKEVTRPVNRWPVKFIQMMLVVPRK